MSSINETELSLYEKIKNCFSEAQSSKTKLLKLIFSYIVDTQCAWNPYFCGISNEMKEEIVNCLIMAYIEIWLENDEYNKQSIDSYIENLSLMQSQPSTPGHESLDTTRREMYRGETLVRTNISLQHDYSEDNNLLCKKPLNRLGYRNKHTLLELEEFYRASVEPLNIYRDIFKNKEPYHTKNRSAFYLNCDIAERDIADYNVYLEHIKGLILENNSIATKNNKEFVVKCLFVWKHEYTYRYRFTATLAKYLSDRKYGLDSIYIPDTIKYYRAPYPDPLPDGRLNVRYSYFTKKYDEIISGGFSDKDEQYRDAVMIARICYNMCFSIICRNIRSVTLLGPWDDNDFEDVACFMIKDFGIKECLEMPDMGDVTAGGVSPYSYIRELFKIPDYIDPYRIAYYKENSKGRKK